MLPCCPVALLTCLARASVRTLSLLPQVTELMATFRGDPVRGYILFRQTVTTDGTVGDTVIFFDLQGLQGYAGPLKWHLHDTAISSAADCLSAGAHYDPTLCVAPLPARSPATH